MAPSDARPLSRPFARHPRPDSSGRFLQDGTRHPHAANAGARAGGRRRGRQLLRQQLSRLGRRSRARRRRAGWSRSLWLRHGLRALHLRHAERAPGARGRALRVSRHRRRDPLLELLRRERRIVRDAARGRGRRHQRRTEPREHRRRHQALQSAPLPVPQQRHGGSRREIAGSGSRRRALQADRDRWRVLDGRHHRGPRVASATSRRRMGRS